MDYVEAWKADKNLDVPYVQQLVKNIRWSIIMGKIRRTDKLPPIRKLASELGVSVNTVRSAYKQLEEQGLVVTRPHHGTTVLSLKMDKQILERQLSMSIKDVLHSGLSVSDARAICEQVLDEAERQSRCKKAILVDTDQKLMDRYAEQIQAETNLCIQKIYLDDLQEYLVQHSEEADELEAIITTYFYYGQVQQIAREYRPIICGMAVEMSQAMVDQLRKLPAGTTVGIVCGAKESRVSLKNLFDGIRKDLTFVVCDETETEQLEKLLEEVSALCITPTAGLLPKLADGSIPVFEIWDKINEQSMNMFREYLKVGGGE